MTQIGREWTLFDAVIASYRMENHASIEGGPVPREHVILRGATEFGGVSQ